ncbi:DUF924 family protein [Maricurvus nonylphenolicus]|uniref:DUF924 family protein n=1 Tax=Maricurvus nonylphenolicus TaxID=1008307 RepID=UPI0036F1AC6B
MHKEVLNFWFEEIDPKQWWQVDAEFDKTIEKRFGQLLQRASLAELFIWRETDLGRLAEIIVLDQFSRNVFRNSPQAFSQDPMALVLAQEAVAQGALERLDDNERCFLLMPYMHSESAAVHLEAEKLFKQYTPENNYDFELRHKEIIDRFGRYPHRNSIVGRESTQEEIEFLKQPGSSF